MHCPGVVPYKFIFIIVRIPKTTSCLLKASNSKAKLDIKGVFSMNCFLSAVVLSGLVCAQASSLQVAASPERPGATFPAKTQDIPVNVALLPNLPALPQGKATMLGGTINGLDRVREELILRTFGGGRIKVLFDGRTRIYLNGINAGHRRDLRDGQRVHLDTMLDGTKIFAKNIYVLTSTPTGESYGQVVSYTPTTNELQFTDSLSSAAIKLRLVPSTRVRQQEHLIAPTALRPGSLVSVTFETEGDGRAVAREILLLAEPGDVFQFAGRVTHLDLRAGVMVVENLLDHKSFEINLTSSLALPGNDFHEGSNVTVSIAFEGTRYVARTVTVNSPSAK